MLIYIPIRANAMTERSSGGDFSESYGVVRHGMVKSRNTLVSSRLKDCLVGFAGRSRYHEQGHDSVL